MLILSRRESESVHLGDDIVLTIVRVSGEKVRIGIKAPPHIKVLRNELESIVDIVEAVSPAESPATTVTSVTPPAVPPVSTPRKPPIQVRRAA